MKKLLAIVMAAMMVLALVACGSTAASSAPASSAAASTPASSAPASSTAASTATSTADYSGIKIGVLLKPESNTYWSGMGAAITEWAKQTGATVDIYYAESEENISGQLEQMENMIAKGYDAICAAPLSASNLVQGVKEATDAGIIVVNVDEQIDPAAVKEAGGAMYAQYTTDNILVGEKAATYITQKITSGKVAIIEGTAGNATSQARTKGATDYFAKQSGIELVASTSGDWDRLTAQDVATAMITANPDLKAIYCCNDVMALGAVAAVQNANKTDSILVVGTDATADGKTSISNGEESATIGQDNEGIGIKCCIAACEAVKAGWKPADHVGEDVKVEYVDSFLVTPENVKDYM